MFVLVKRSEAAGRLFSKVEDVAVGGKGGRYLCLMCCCTIWNSLGIGACQRIK